MYYRHQAWTVCTQSNAFAALMNTERQGWVKKLISHGVMGNGPVHAESLVQTPPADVTWLSLIMTMSNRPIRWLLPPPISTADLSGTLKPGAVFPGLKNAS